MNFGWNQRNTGRKEGFPGNQSEPHLQDRLEYYKPSDSAFELASLAFRKIAFPACPPRAPRKDHKDNHTATLQSLMDNPEWEQFMSTIPEDDISPTD
ncbi:hypothetical protein E8E13_010863 [Curvularia kusanoi]|uniref:Uncharacterized protein n=1 Tax=Curvularia kusanoi TaxID=90978 RepID=A0A9P4TIZ4_CURKU|nr:hypothetical protein E8E13_010863 [Curvularia kusanoi]